MADHKNRIAHRGPTGRFITASAAKKSPNTTVKEKVPLPGRGTTLKPKK